MKLHLGCGRRYFPGFVHVDLVPHPHVDVLHACDSLPMFADASVDTLVSCHLLEHWRPEEVPRVLAEWFRVLAPGGTLRVAVPDFAALVALYVRTGDYALVKGPLFGRGDQPYNLHYAAYDFPTLKAALEAAGFDRVRRYDWRATEHAGVDDYSQAYYPHMDKANGLLLSLNVEATRP